MGTGALKRYQHPDPQTGFDHNAWRMPKQQAPQKKRQDAAIRSRGGDSASVATVQKFGASLPNICVESAAVAPGAQMLAPPAFAVSEGAPVNIQPAVGSSSVNGSRASTANSGKWSHSGHSHPAEVVDVQSVMHPSGGSGRGTCAGDGGGLAQTFPVEEDEDDLAGFSNLADVANKVWDDLLHNKEHADGANVETMFVLSDMKECVERAAKRLEALRTEAARAAAVLHEKNVALEVLCSKLEGQVVTVASNFAQWKLGDLAIRRGKGICELSMVHHEAVPPYFEVRMAIGGNIVGTESSNLIPLPIPQISLVRAALRELEQARSRQQVADEAVSSAQEDLSQQHQALTDKVEKTLTGIQASCGPAQRDLVAGDEADTDNRTPTASGEGLPPQVSAKSSAPLGFPSFDELSRLQKEAAERERQASRVSAAKVYPGVHSSAAREVIVRPEAGNVGVSGSSYRQRRPSNPANEATPGPQTPDGLGMTTTGIKSSSSIPHVPFGFPELNRTTSQQTGISQSSATLHQHLQTQQRPQVQQQQGAQQFVQQQQQQQSQQVTQEDYAQYAPPNVGSPDASVEDRRYSKHLQDGQEPQPDWVLYRTADGQPYFHNEKTNHTSWQLPSGARYRDSLGLGTGSSTFGVAYASQKDVSADDPFFVLRKKEEEMQKQRDDWTQWYHQYYQWYQQQTSAWHPTNSNVPSNAPPHFTGDRTAAGQNQRRTNGSTAPTQNAGAQGCGGSSGAGCCGVPPKGPAPPVLSVGFEDTATFAIKSSVLKEMEAMVAREAPLVQRKKALRCLQMRWHPDKNPDRLEVAKHVFQFIEETKPWFLHSPDSDGTA